MLDIQLLRNNIDFVCERLATRGYVLDTATFQTLESERKTLQTRTQDLQASRNSLSKQIGQLKAKGEDATAVLAEVATLKSELDANEQRLSDLGINPALGGSLHKNALVLLHFALLLLTHRPPQQVGFPK